MLDVYEKRITSKGALLASQLTLSVLIHKASYELCTFNQGILTEGEGAARLPPSTSCVLY